MENEKPLGEGNNVSYEGDEASRELTQKLVTPSGVLRKKPIENFLAILQKLVRTPEEKVKLIPSETALRDAQLELDKTPTNTIETISPMGVEDGRSGQQQEFTPPAAPAGEARASGDVTQQLANQEPQIPAGVSRLQWDFLCEAWRTGAHERIKPKTAEIIDRYYHTEDTHADIARDCKVSEQAIQQRIASGMVTIRRVLYKSNPELAQEDTYPLGQIRKAKEPLVVARTEKSRERRRVAGKKGSEAGKRGGRPPKVNKFVTKPLHV